MRRITGKAKDETLIELQSAAESQTTGEQQRGLRFILGLVFLEGLFQNRGAFRGAHSDQMSFIERSPAWW